jgi:hypothetical protein
MATLADILRQTGYAQGGTLATPTPTESPMTKVLTDHIASLPQKFNENQAHQMDLLARAYPGNTFKSNMLEGDPKALSELAMQAPIMGLTAFHGTPHKIKGLFDINKVGTGEGAQSFGHGMYFAENPAVAKGYADKLGYDYQYAGKTPKENSPIDLALRWLKNLDWDKEAAKAQWKNEGLGAQVIQAIDKLDLQKIKKPGNLYKVDIPDEQIPNMLDWDKPFKDQNKAVQQAIKQIEPKIRQINPNLNVENLDGKGIYQAYQQYRGNQPDFASEGLNEIGIKGIRYLDQGSRNPGFSSLTPTQLQSRIELLQKDINSGAGNTQKMKDQLQGLQNELNSYSNMTSNFVVFDPSTVKILEENGKALTRKELIEKQVKKLKD